MLTLRGHRVIHSPPLPGDGEPPCEMVGKSSMVRCGRRTRLRSQMSLVTEPTATQDRSGWRSPRAAVKADGPEGSNVVVGPLE